MTGENALSLETARDAELAAALLAIDPSGLRGATLRARAGPVRDAWLSVFRTLFPHDTPCRKLPFGADQERIFGGLDLAATLSCGTPVYERGLLGDIGDGLLVIPMAERVQAGLAARLCGVLDEGAAALSGDPSNNDRGLKPTTIAFDESCGDDDPPAPSLLERLGLWVDLTSIRMADYGFAFVTFDRVEAARERLRGISVDEKIAASLVEVADSLGIKSLRPALFACKAARASAALAGRNAVTEADAVAAIRLVLAPRAVTIPMSDPSEAESEAETGGDNRNQNDESADSHDERDSELTERLIESAKAALPPNLLARVKLRAARTAKILPGRFGDERANLSRGRRAGTIRGKPSGGAKLDLVATLRAAAPWQSFRRRELANAEQSALDGVLTRSGDFRLRRFKTGTQTVTIFAVDASGSTALERLGEAKGAVELILAECYIRRDQVAMIAFRGRSAEILLPPTRSLVRAKRTLAALAGGGGTPLAAGLDAAQSVAFSVRRRGGLPVIVILTDGKANVGRDGKGGRDQAQKDAMASAKLMRAANVQAIVVDTSSRPSPAAAALAKEMQATYLPLPNANAATLSAAAMSVVR